MKNKTIKDTEFVRGEKAMGGEETFWNMSIVQIGINAWYIYNNITSQYGIFYILIIIYVLIIIYT